MEVGDSSVTADGDEDAGEETEERNVVVEEAGQTFPLQGLIKTVP